VDHFHLVKLANDCVTKVRRPATWDQKGRRGRQIDPAWANRRRLLSAKERLRPKAFAAMWNALIDSDPSGQILTAWIAKEELRTLLALARTGASRDRIASQLWVFYDWCASTTIDELHTLAGTVETWWPEIEAFIDTGITNAKTEGFNRLVSRSSAPAAAFAMSRTNTAEYGSTAPAPRGQRQRQQDHCPSKFEDPACDGRKTYRLRRAVRGDTTSRTTAARCATSCRSGRAARPVAASRGSAFLLAGSTQSGGWLTLAWLGVQPPGISSERAGRAPSATPARQPVPTVGVQGGAVVGVRAGRSCSGSPGVATQGRGHAARQDIAPRKLTSCR
jgi:transposase